MRTSERYRRPIVCNVYRDPIELFDRHLYEKGAAVLHMLRGELGWERMKRALRRYVDDNATRQRRDDRPGARDRSVRPAATCAGFSRSGSIAAGHPELEVRAIVGRRALGTDARDRAEANDRRRPSAVCRSTSIVGLCGRCRRRSRATRVTAASPASSACACTSSGRTSRSRSPRREAGADPHRSRRLPAVHDDLCARDRAGTRAILRGDPSPVARIRAARALGKDAARGARTRARRRAARRAVLGRRGRDRRGAGQGACGRMRATALLAAARASAPQSTARRRRRAGLVSRAPRSPTRCWPARSDASYFVVGARLRRRSARRATPAHSTRSCGALAEPSWNETIAAGAARGLAELADARALRTAAGAPSRAGSARAVAARGGRRAGALGRRWSTRCAPPSWMRSSARSTIRHYLVRVSTYAACETLADARLLPALDRLADDRERRPLAARCSGSRDARPRRGQDAARAGAAARRSRPPARRRQPLARPRPRRRAAGVDVRVASRAAGSRSRCSGCATARSRNRSRSCGRVPVASPIRRAAKRRRGARPICAALRARLERPAGGLRRWPTSGIAIVDSPGRPLFVRRDARRRRSRPRRSSCSSRSTALQTLGPGLPLRNAARSARRARTTARSTATSTWSAAAIRR